MEALASGAPIPIAAPIAALTAGLEAATWPGYCPALEM